MTTILKGGPVAEALHEETAKKVEEVKKRGIVPLLAMLGVGDREDDASYARGIEKACEKTGIACRKELLPEGEDSEVFYQRLRDLSEDSRVHGILLFRPLPKGFCEERARAILPKQKDVDACREDSLCSVFMGDKESFSPCTPQAVMEILSFYKIEPEGKRVVVIGRSLVVGKPLSMLLLEKNATVTICHSRTRGLEELCRQADIIVSCSGQMESIGRDYIGQGQIVIDVGISWNEEKGRLCGDVRREEVEDLLAAITPVPGGVGAVTSAVLVSHVAEAARRLTKEEEGAALCQ